MSNSASSSETATAPAMPASELKEVTLRIREDIRPAFTEQIIAAVYDAFPDLYMPNTISNTIGQQFPHEKYLMWRLGVDSLEDVIVLHQTTVFWDAIASPEIVLRYSMNRAYCAEHRTYMTATDEHDQHPHYFNYHGLDENQYLETRHL